jgi:membrane-associated protease RseP (regulator of RpoE activity)
LPGTAVGVICRSSDDRLDPVEEVFMRKLSAALVTAILSLAPAAMAGPGTGPQTPDPWARSETFEWMSSSQGARLGVMVMSLTPDLRIYFGAPNDKGVLVAKVEPGSTAAKAGIKVGDVIVQVKDTKIDEASDVLEALSDAKQGDKIKLEIVRDKKQLAIDATIGAIKPVNTGELDWFHKTFPWFDEWTRSFPRRSTST